MLAILKRVLSVILLLGPVAMAAPAADEMKAVDLSGEGRKSVRLLVSPDGKTLAGLDDQGTVRLWNLATGKTLGTLSTPANGLAFSPDGKLLAIGGPKVVQVWTVATRLLDCQITHGGLQTHAVAFSPDGTSLAVLFTASISSRVEDNRPEAEKKIWPNGHVTPEGEFRGPRTISTTTYGAGVWRLDRVETIDRRDLGPILPQGISLDATGKKMLLGDRRLLQPGRIQLEIAAGNRIIGRTLDRRGQMAEVMKLTFPTTVHRIAFAEAIDLDRIVALHEPLDPQAVPYLRIHQRDGDEGTVLAEVRQPHGTAPVVALVLTPDGKSAITAAADGSVKLWSLPAAR